jgi:hypothetical protein
MVEVNQISDCFIVHVNQPLGEGALVLKPVHQLAGAISSSSHGPAERREVELGDVVKLILHLLDEVCPGHWGHPSNV